MVVVVHNDLTRVVHIYHSKNPLVVHNDHRDRVVYGTNHIRIPLGVIYSELFIIVYN